MKSVALTSSYWLDHPVPCHLDDVPTFRKILKGTGCRQIAVQEVKADQYLTLRCKILSWRIVFDENSKRYCLAYVMKSEGFDPYFYQIISEGNDLVVKRIFPEHGCKKGELLKKVGGYTKIFHLQAINK